MLVMFIGWESIGVAESNPSDLEELPVSILPRPRAKDSTIDDKAR